MIDTAQELPKLATAREVAAATTISLPHLYSLVRADSIPHIRLGSRAVRFSIPAVLAWIESGGSVGET